MTPLLPLLAQEAGKLSWDRMPSPGRIAPELFLCLWAVVILVVDLVRGKGSWKHFTTLSLVGCAIAFALAVFTAPGNDAVGYGVGSGGVGALTPDAISRFFKLIFLATGFLTVLFMRRSADAYAREPELHVILFGALAGACYLAGASELIGFYLAFEMVSYTGFLLAGYRVDDPKSAEAGGKFVMFGAVSSAVMLFGLSLVYGATGSMQFADIAKALASQDASPALLVASVFVFAGFAFKAAAFPMQFWCPDVYEGAPAPVAMFLAVASKAAVFSAAIRVLMLGPVTDTAPTLTQLLPHGATVTQTILIFASAATMCWGNFAALRQTNLQRMLAYSSIAHAGYLLMTAAVVVPGAQSGRDAVSAMLFSFVIYLVMSAAAFYVVTVMRRDAGTAEVGALRGFAAKHPLFAACFALVLFSLTGLPPTAGFIAKLQLFQPVVGEGHFVLAAIGLLNGAVSLYFYAKPIGLMYLASEGPPERTPAPNGTDRTILAVLSAPLLVLGLLWWDSILEFAQTAVAAGRNP
ncbi:MAG: NADH-quinone oxidoreductase subunit N [Planctomycetes bacterium]|nr:NADH-quinone oxidoreductase subunit N [Planctomycetota bacterium]